jgi:hypothetical protein
VLPQIEELVIRRWAELPGSRRTPRRISFLGQATGVSKVCFFIFADADTAPCYIAKMPRSPAYNDHFGREVETIERLRSIVPDRLRNTLPGPMLRTTLSDLWVVVEPVLRGRPLDNGEAINRPLAPQVVTHQLVLGRRWLADIQREAEPWRDRLGPSQIDEHFIQPIRLLQQQAELGAREDDYLDRLAAEAHALEGHEMPLVLCHGDFRAGNILVDHDRLSVLDWEFSRPLAPPLIDWFSFVFRLYSGAVGLPDIDGPLEDYRAAFRHVFFTRNWFSSLAEEQTRLLCRDLSIDEAQLPFLFALFVVSSANKFRSFLDTRAARGYLYLLDNGSATAGSYRSQLDRQAYVWLLGDLAANEAALTLR